MFVSVCVYFPALAGRAYLKRQQTCSQHITKQTGSFFKTNWLPATKHYSQIKHVIHN
jgi:hypothetical protein